MTISTPDWVKDAVFYQIIPDRFAKSDRTTHPRGIQFKPWGTPPSEQGYQGGDLYGIIDKLDYLQALGVTALYLCPVFSSASNHRYHTYDYMQVDPLLGGNDALRELIDELHQRDMRIILDGVFNHASRGFWAFHHILENGGNSPYIDWFHIQDFPLRPYQHDDDNPLNYSAWWDIAALPKFNTDNLGVRDYLMDVARYWIDFGADGWRLDVPDEIDDDAFWCEFRRVVKEANPEAYIVGEIWGDATRWLQGDQFDAVMNYLVPRATIRFTAGDKLNFNFDNGQFEGLEPMSGTEYQQEIDDIMALYDSEIVQTQLNLLNSHDTPRLIWQHSEDEAAARLSVLIQFTLPGAPCIYYGDEIGMSGGNDPECRGAFLWHEPDNWNADILAFFKSMIALRNDNLVLRRGDFQSVFADETLYAFSRTLDNQQALIVVNRGADTCQTTIPIHKTGTWHVAYASDGVELKAQSADDIHIQLSAQSSIILLAD